MAKVIEFDKKFVARDGLVEMVRGDDISLECYIVQESGSYKEILNLGDLGYVGATGWFKPQDSTMEAVKSVVSLNTCPKLIMDIPASGSELLYKNQNGEDMFMVLEDSSGKFETIFTNNQPLAVIDRGFKRF